MYHVCEAIRWVSVHHCEALLFKRRQKAHPLFSYLFYQKAQRFVDIVSAQIKVDPLQFRIMYYSYLYEQKMI